MGNVVFQIKGKKPDPVETEKLSGLSFGSSKPGSAEVKDAVKWFAIGIVAAVILFIIGRWVIRNFVGIGVLIFGYGAAYLAAPINLVFGIVSLVKLFRPARKKTPSDALKWVWMTSVLGEDAVGERFGAIPYSLSTMRRLLPEGCGYEEAAFEAYVTSFRKAMSEAADETTAPLRVGGWHETGPGKDCKVISENMLSDKLCEVQAQITYKDELALTNSNNQTNYKVACVLELNIDQYYVLCGKFWFPYDIMPAFERVDGGSSGSDDSGAEDGQQAM